MLLNGKFLLLLDSFDEIPAILDVDESDYLVTKLSRTIETFLAEIDSRCIITSRFSTKPKLNPDSKLSILEILPFSDLQIKQALHQSIKYNRDEIIEELFTNRTELIPIARNPFMMALFGQYASTNESDRLPNKQIELYENHLETRLKSSQCQYKLDRLKLNLSVDRIIDICIKIAWLMFKENYGLEISLSDLQKELQVIDKNNNIDKIIEVLKVAGLARVGGANKEKYFSFVHSRFYNYLVAKYLLDRPNEVQLDNIFDPKWRDVLVLYCDFVSSEKPLEAKKIANFCWQKIKNERQDYSQKNDNNKSLLRDFIKFIANYFKFCWQKIKNERQDYSQKNDSNKLDALYSIRFLADAFKSRPEYIKDIQTDIFKFIEQQVEEKNNIFFAKANIKAIGILTNEQIERICLIALLKNNDLLSETAIRHCRHLPKTSKELQFAIIDYLESIPCLEFIQRRKEILFNFQLGDGFKRITRYCYARNLDYFILIVLFGLRIFSITPLFTAWFLTAILTCPFYISIQLVLNYSKDLTICQLISKYFLDNRTLIMIRFLALPLLFLEFLCLYFFPTPYKEEYLSKLLPILDLIPISRTILFSVLLIMTGASLIFLIPWYRLPDSLQRLPYLIKKHLNWKSILILIALVLLIIAATYNQNIATFINLKIWPGFLKFLRVTFFVLGIKFVRDSWQEQNLDK